MLRVCRIAVSLIVAGGLLWAAELGAGDCSTGPYSSDNCLWLDVRRRFHLPTSRLVKMGTLEAAGLVLLAGLYLNFRYVWPHRRRPQQQASEVHGEVRG